MKAKKQKHIYFFVGTTAEFIKLAPVIKELRSRRIKFKIITSGQNKINFKDIESFTGKIKPDIVFQEKNVKSSIPHFFVWTIRTIIKGFLIFGKEFTDKKRKSIFVIIHGDTISSLVGAVLARFYGVKLIHVEAGLRSSNWLEPLPEEIIRNIIDRISDVLFCQNDLALQNVKDVRGDKINTFENTLSEICIWATRMKNKEYFPKKFGKYYILFIHRQEHIYYNKNWTRNIMDLVIRSADKNLTCIVVLHALTSRFLESEKIEAFSKKNKKLILVPKLPYIDFMHLMKNAEFMATDGCTPQEEAYYMGLPFLALRNLTERIEGVGENVVISKGSDNVIKNFLGKYKKYKRKPVKVKRRPSKIIVDYLLDTRKI